MSERKYSRIFRTPGVISPILMIAVLITGCSTGFVPSGDKEVSVAPSIVASSNSPTNGMVQSSDGGAVTIDVEWISVDDALLVFKVSMNTHSTDLDQYDLGELATLRDNGSQEYRPAFWDSAPGGHHRRGTLTFPVPDSLEQGEAMYVEIVIRDIAEVNERVLRWEL